MRVYLYICLETFFMWIQPNLNYLHQFLIFEETSVFVSIKGGQIIFIEFSLVTSAYEVSYCFHFVSGILLKFLQRWVQSLENVDIYSTLEPTMQYQARIAFMIDIHKQCTLALRYPPKLLGHDANSAEDEKSRRQREAADLEELEELDDDDDDDDLFP